ncbi:hypothetical protein JCM14635_22320 [Megalodesulfovibrio paquesii]
MPAALSPSPVSSPVELALRERVKELECLYAVSRLAQRPELPLNALGWEVAGLLCRAWRYPELAVARVELEGQGVASPGFVRTAWRQTREILAHGTPAGRLELCYLRWPSDQAAEDEAPFLEEEDRLLQAVAEQLGRMLESRRAEARLQALSRELIRAQEAERQRIARELHDDVAQTLSMLKIGLESLPDRQTGQAELLPLAAAAGQAIEAVRGIAYDLMPPGLAQLGLVSTIFKLCEDVSARCNLPVTFRAEGMDAVPLDFEHQINLYRIVQEALSNVRQHAGAGRVEVKLVAAHPSLFLRVEDDGRGFDPHLPPLDGRHMGLWSMDERARLLGGTLQLRSTPGRGTKVIVELPLTNAPGLKPGWNGRRTA